jgi:hypothetical protein
MSAYELAVSLARMDGSGPLLIALVLTLLWHISSQAKSGFGSIKRLGARIGRGERRTALLEQRVGQLEQLLRDEGVPVPRQAPPAVDEDLDEDDEPATAHVPVPPIPPMPQTLRRNR